MKYLRCSIMIGVTCILLYSAYQFQGEEIDNIISFFNEEYMAEAATTVEDINALPQNNIIDLLPDDLGAEISCPAEDALRGNQFEAIQIPTVAKKHYIMEEVLPMENLYTGTDVDNYFADAIFVGDSITVGLSNYCRSSKGGGFSGPTQFLAQIGCSAKMCISANPTEKYQKYMPSFSGRICKVEDGIALSGAKKVFIDYGLNDLTGSTPDRFYQDFTSLITKILNKNPDVEIYIISTTYVVDQAQKGMLTNKNIRNANEKMKSYCMENGYGYINIADYLTDEAGGLNAKYSSDQYVHQNAKSYGVWLKVLRNYAYMEQSIGN